MSEKISIGQLQRNTAAYAVDDFRKMVNYETGTNKGYVRFSMGQDGKLKLEKFNNKVDVPLSWRSNTKSEHNRAMREKFAAALGGNLKYGLGKGESLLCVNHQERYKYEFTVLPQIPPSNYAGLNESIAAKRLTDDMRAAIDSVK